MKIALLIFGLVISPVLMAKDYFVGEITSQQIMSDFKRFKKHADDVNYTKQQLAALAQIEDDIQIKVFFGQWCHDSQREVPRLIQLFDKLNKDNFDVWYYALNGRKSDPQNQAEQHEIRRTPTIIVYRDGKEIARVLEFPEKDWPSDLSKILML